MDGVMRMSRRIAPSLFLGFTIFMAPPFVGPGRSMAAPVISANFLTTAPTLDGTVNAAEYGGGPAFTADFSNLNASNPSRLSSFLTNTFVTRTTADYSYDLYAAFTSSTLYL